MATVRLESLRKEFDAGDIVAVDDVDLTVNDGEFLTVVGPSGCGKSTTLRMVAGLERPTDGRVYIGDRDVTDRHARKRDVAMVFQNYALYPHKTVFQNMEFGLRMSTDLTKAERREKVEWAADMMGIGELLEQQPDELSGGQKQRVALGRAIVREPDVFLFDEPLSNLDAKLRVEMRTEIQRLQDELDITALYVTHDQEEAMTMGDRMAILENGVLQQVGEPKEVYRNPANEFVGSFVGSPSMNFLEVEAHNTGGELRLVDPDGNFDVALNGQLSELVSGGTSYTAGIRPEDVFITDNGLETTVEVVEPVGSDNYVYLDLGHNFIARVDAAVEPSMGERVHVSFDESDLHLFGDDGTAVRTDGVDPTRTAAASRSTSST
ncbi:ABC-type spermidine/putrescine transport system,ATPase component [Halalkaliarchaeum sp. AArc-CO]|uniref:ABC transporter ATP-binding protein n=1 Tax=Halalkaliarchaeum sp. AArc-CO TaxID=2866381 RepID=UPI00217DE16A|nr:ABC transporter ATP-binding protein [Halalkaliarchaeum sp. AArc-CO]UWG49823.1 ABC-type spermidine/putrescine transport system,ATPase component [Halalkaliarchaeum sp. AArc-CO]